MTSQLEIVINATKKLESLLTLLGAEGRGLQEKCDSVAYLLPPEIVGSVKYLARNRNKLLHEDGFELSDLGAFQYQASSAIAYLEKVTTYNQEVEEPVRKGITVTIPDKVIHHVPIEELEWFSAQAPLFSDPAEKPKS
ncbi:hypothetical protein GPJ81_16910 [Pseudomonas alkylphenolica]|uniref:Uncharacterized protein n=1 Tax=Pseudomonas alkylphenolica TaxID=237609 RepID=A0A6I6HDE3_9PSED|nr:hypothetical protein [Pseudomonas alkylphenolica]QGW78295.1 hypothetical protein GPJ81_16910 [Pseudomonas alkylphenolica]